MRQGRMNLKESFATVKDGEMIVHGMHISPYEQGNIFNTDPLRQKRLLLHRSEIRHLAQESGRKLFCQKQELNVLFTIKQMQILLFLM